MNDEKLLLKDIDIFFKYFINDFLNLIKICYF